MKLRNIKQQYRVNWASVPLGRDLGLGGRASWAVHGWWCMGGGAWVSAWCGARCWLVGRGRGLFCVVIMTSQDECPHCRPRKLGLANRH